MASSPISLETHARHHLMQDNLSPIPSSYLAELQGFLNEFPNDTKFTIRRDYNFGVLSCLEAGCDGLSIPLASLPGLPAGSVGSLNPYKSHIRHHPTHAANRTARVRAEILRAAKTGPSQGTGGGKLLAALSMNAMRTHPHQAKPVPRISSTRSISRKVPGGKVVELIELSDSDDSDDHKSKRPRISSPVKRPLGVSNPNTPISPSPQSVLPKVSLPIAATVMAPSQGNPVKAKENSNSTENVVLLQRNAAIQAKIREYEMQVLMNIRKGAKGVTKVSKYTLKLQNARAEAEKIQRHLNELSRMAGPVASTSAAPMDSSPVHSQPPRPQSTQQAMAQPSWQPGMGDLMKAFGSSVASELGEGPLVEDDLLGYEESILPHQPIQHPIPARRVNASITDFHSFFENANQNWFGGDKTVQNALQGLELDNVGDNLPGMETSLLAHQVIGVNWMKSREQEKAKFARGGILADAMGLGKTVQTIGIICANPSDDPNCSATLIVAPLSLLQQWKQEILDMTEEGSLKVLIYHGANRPKQVKDVLQYDIVLTTYQTLANEWPDELEEVKKKKRKSKKKKADDFISDGSEDDGMVAKRKRKCGPLMDIEWYRVVLDEAQNIRNARTRASTAVTHVIADIRWCLTGTPLTNGLNDAYGLLRFIRHRPFGDWEQFREISRASDARAAKRVQSALAGVILRRTKESELDGKKLIELPIRNEDWVPLEFMEEERAIYSFVEARSQAIFNKFLQAGTVLKNYSQVLVMLMRLRQICVHPCLLKVYESAFEVKDTRSSEAKNVVEEAARLVSNEYVVHVKKQLRDAALDRMKLEKEKGDAATVEDNCSICFEPHGEEAVITAPCAHIYCRGCIEAHINKPRTEDDARFGPQERDCPMCRQVISIPKLFVRKAFEPTDEELGVSSDLDGFNIDWEVDTTTGEGRYKAQAIGKRKARKSDHVDDESDLDDFIMDDDEPLDDRSYESKPKRSSRGTSRPIIISDTEDEKVEDVTYLNSDEDGDIEDIEVATKKLKTKQKVQIKRKGVIASDSEEEVVASGAPKRARVDVVNKPTMISSFMPSTKMQYMMRKLLEVAETHPDDKTMVVSQWTSALDLCSDYLNENNIRHVSFKGSMSVREKNEAIQAFMKKSNIKVMLMSLKAGGVGLNLTRGNRVMSLDAGWSNAVDQQAFDRVHRLGQKKEVFIERVVISNTVEQRVQDIQTRKQALSDGVLGEGTGERMRLSVGELATLFGLGPAVE